MLLRPRQITGILFILFGVAIFAFPNILEQLIAFCFIAAGAVSLFPSHT
jgi:drug/metabolite transporter (DMT)-like permease